MVIKNIGIDEKLHKKIKIKVVEGCAYKTMQDFVNAALENELHELE